MHATVHRQACIRCGLCPSLCPEVFILPEGETAQVIADPVPGSCLVAAQGAADSCPVGAIHIF